MHVESKSGEDSERNKAPQDQQHQGQRTDGLHQPVESPMPLVQPLDTLVEAAALGKLRIDKDTTMVELDSIGGRNGLVEVDGVPSGLQTVEVSAQPLMQVHQCRVDVVEAGREPQSCSINLRGAFRCANRDNPWSLRVRLK